MVVTDPLLFLWAILFHNFFECISPIQHRYSNYFQFVKITNFLSLICVGMLSFLMVGVRMEWEQLLVTLDIVKSKQLLISEL